MVHRTLGRDRYPSGIIPAYTVRLLTRKYGCSQYEAEFICRAVGHLCAKPKDGQLCSITRFCARSSPCTHHRLYHRKCRRPFVFCSYKDPSSHWCHRSLTAVVTSCQNGMRVTYMLRVALQRRPSHYPRYLQMTDPQHMTCTLVGITRCVGPQRYFRYT